MRVSVCVAPYLENENFSVKYRKLRKTKKKKKNSLKGKKNERIFKTFLRTKFSLCSVFLSTVWCINVSVFVWQYICVRAFNISVLV